MNIKISILLLLISTSAFANQRLYEQHCIRCHNKSPDKIGTIGPELVTTPKAVVLQKVPTGSYPKEYKPKRKTKIMPKFKLSVDQVSSIYYYIQMFKVNK